MHILVCAQNNKISALHHRSKFKYIFQDGKPFPENLKEFLYNDNKFLNIDNPTPADNGVYKCVAENRVGKVEKVIHFKFYGKNCNHYY